MRPASNFDEVDSGLEYLRNTMDLRYGPLSDLHVRKFFAEFCAAMDDVESRGQEVTISTVRAAMERPYREFPSGMKGHLREIGFAQFEEFVFFARRCGILLDEDEDSMTRAAEESTLSLASGVRLGFGRWAFPENLSPMVRPDLRQAFLDFKSGTVSVYDPVRDIAITCSAHTAKKKGLLGQNDCVLISGVAASVQIEWMRAFADKNLGSELLPAAIGKRPMKTFVSAINKNKWLKQHWGIYRDARLTPHVWEWIREAGLPITPYLWRY